MDDRDRCHFVELLGECVGRHGVRLHAYALMSNHYHLLVQTPHANLSRAAQWLNVAYVVWGCDFTPLHRPKHSEVRSQHSELIPNNLA